MKTYSFFRGYIECFLRQWPILACSNKTPLICNKLSKLCSNQIEKSLCIAPHLYIEIRQRAIISAFICVTSSTSRRKPPEYFPFFRSMTSFVAPSIEAAGSSAKIQIFTVCCFVVLPIEVTLVEGELYRRNDETANGQTSPLISYLARQMSLQTNKI